MTLIVTPVMPELACAPAGAAVSVSTCEFWARWCSNPESVWETARSCDCSAPHAQEAMEIADDTSALGGSGEFAQYFARNASQAALAPAMSSSLGNGAEDSEAFSVRSMGRNNSQARAAHPDPCACVSLVQHSRAQSAAAKPHHSMRVGAAMTDT